MAKDNPDSYPREYVERRLADCVDSLIACSRGNFSKFPQVSSESDSFDALAIGISMMLEDLQSRWDKSRQAEKEAILAAKMAGIAELAAGITREINQPLHGLRITASSLRRDIQKGRLTIDDLKSDLEEVEAYIVRMATIIDHMCVYSRDSNSIALEWVDVNDVIRGAVKVFRVQLRNENVKVVEEITENLPKVWALAPQLEQVLINLFSNARDALESLPPATSQCKWIRVGSGRAEENGQEFVTISVTDNGGGVPEGNRTKVFEPFFTTKASGAGTGLGLSVSSRILNRFRGRLILNSSEGQSTFKVILPTAREYSDG